MQHILLKEYGDPVQLIFDSRELNIFEKSNKYWKNKLGLTKDPLRLRQIDENIFEVRAEGVTGIVKIGAFDLEIKPKFIGDSNKWQIILWKILSFIDRDATDKNFTSVNNENNHNLIELLIDVFVKSFTNGSSKGLPLGYKSQPEAGYDLKGNFDQSRILEWVNKPWIYPYVVDELSEDTILTRLLHWTAVQLMDLTSSSKKLKELEIILVRLREVSKIPPNIREVRKIKLSMQHKELEPAFNIGRVLLENFELGYGKGQKLISGFLWNSDKIYEQFISLICAHAAKKLQLQVSKDSYEYGTVILGNGSGLRTIPDIVFKNSKNIITSVADAKYKIYQARPKSEDVYQILAACHILGTNKGALLYPVYANKQYKSWNIKSQLGAVDIVLTMIPINMSYLEDNIGFIKLIDDIFLWLNCT